MKKRIVAICIAICVLIMEMGVTVEPVQAASFAGAKVYNMSTLTQFKSKAKISWQFSVKTKKGQGHVYRYARFTLKQDSIVRIDATQKTGKNQPYGVWNLYSDAGMKKSVRRCCAGKVSDGRNYIELKKGTYYIKYDIVNKGRSAKKCKAAISIGAMSSKNAIVVKKKYDPKKKGVIVSFRQNVYDKNNSGLDNAVIQYCGAKVTTNNEYDYPWVMSLGCSKLSGKKVYKKIIKRNTIITLRTKLGGKAKLTYINVRVK